MKKTPNDMRAALSQVLKGIYSMSMKMRVNVILRHGKFLL